MRTSGMLICVISFLCMVFLSFPVFASVTGTVTDTSGNPVSGALVTFSDESKPDNYFFDYTDESGRYEIIPSVVYVAEDKPIPFTLRQNFPNPFNPSTTIPFSLDNSGHIRLTIYNVMGQEIKTLVDGYRSSGMHTVVWDGRDADGKAAASGLYLYRLTYGDKSESRKMLLLDGGGVVTGADVSTGKPHVAKPTQQVDTSYYSVTVIKGGFFDYSQDNVDINAVSSLDILLEPYTATYETGTTDTNGTTQITDYSGASVTVEFVNAAESPIDNLEIYTISNPYGTTIICSDPLNRYFDSVHHESSNFTQKPAPIIVNHFKETLIDDETKDEYVHTFEGKDAVNIWRDFQIIHKEDPVTWSEILPGEWGTYTEWNKLEKITCVIKVGSFPSNGMLLVRTSFGERAKEVLVSEYNTMKVKMHQVGHWAIFMNDMTVLADAKLWGKVVSEGAVLSGVEISLTNGPSDDIAAVSTNKSGIFEIAGIIPGSYTLDTLEPRSMTITIGESNQIQFGGTAGQSITIGPVKFRDYENSTQTIDLKSGENYTTIELSYSDLASVSPKIYYRTKGQSSFSSSAMTSTTDGAFQGDIPGDIVTTAGIEFKIEGTYSGETVTTPIFSTPVASPPSSGGETTTYKDITFVSIPSDTFRMGDVENYGQYSNEKPVHSVTLSSFEMSIYEVTQGQYQSVMGTNPAKNYGVGDNYPVYYVSWYDAVKFCNKLSDAAGLERCYNESTWACDFGKSGFRLPTEAEWEYACRAGTETNFYTGNAISSDGYTSTDLDRAGWYYGNSGSKTHPAGEKEKNAFGLFDMHGNVWEWCNDWYGESYYTSSTSADPVGPTSGSRRVLRGGSWYNNARYCRSAYRSWNYPSYSYNYLGFRVVRRP